MSQHIINSPVSLNHQNSLPIKSQLSPTNLRQQFQSALLPSENLKYKSSQSSFTNIQQDSNSRQKSQLFQASTTNLELPEGKFVGEDKFKKNIECIVCQIPFGTLKGRQHHCRLCGNSCCSLCSSRTVNSQRSCDICYTKASQMAFEKKRSRFIKSMKQHIINMTTITAAGQQRIKQFDIEIQNDRLQYEDEIEALKSEYNELQLTQNYQDEEKSKLLTILRNFSQSTEPKINQKEQLQVQELDLDKQLRKLDSDIFLQLQNLQEKNDQYATLRQELTELEQCESFVNLSLYQEAAQSEPNNIAQKLIAISDSRKFLSDKSKRTQTNFGSFGNSGQSIQISKSSSTYQIANQLYDSSLLDQNNVKVIMTQDQDIKQHTVRSKNKNSTDQDISGCKAQCGIF